MNYQEDREYDSDDEYVKFSYDGNNDGSSIRFSNYKTSQFFTYFDPTTKSFCRCSACDLDDLNIQQQLKLRNYINKHCISCTCQYCVCNARRINREYSLKIYVHNRQECVCISCEQNENTDYFPHDYHLTSNSYLIRLLKTEIKLYQEYKQTLLNHISNLIPINGLRKIVLEYVSINDISSTEVVKQTPYHDRKYFQNFPSPSIILDKNHTYFPININN